MKCFICQQCEGMTCTASYPFDCNKKYKGDVKSAWTETNKYKIFHYREIEKLKKEAVEEYLKNTKADIIKLSYGGEDYEIPVSDNETAEEIQEKINKIVGAGVISIEKEPELMTLQDAIQKMDFGDSFKIGESGGEVLTMVRHEDDRDMKALKSDLHDDYVVVEPGLLITTGKIIPSEPKVYDVENLIKRYSSTESQRSYTRICDKNGQLKRDEDYKELREESAIVLEDLKSMPDSLHLVNRLNRAFKNLKPLKNQ